MIRANGPITRDGGDDGHDDFDHIAVSDASSIAAWQHLAARHLSPSRLFNMAAGIAEQSEDEVQHLQLCASCHAAYDGYRTPPLPIVLPTDARTGDGCASFSQKYLWNGHALDIPNESQPSGAAPYINAQPIEHVPELLRKHLHVVSPVVFPGEEVANESWQFGRLTQIAREDAALGELLTNTIADAMQAVMLPHLTKSNLMLVCFGRAMHKCGTRLAAKLIISGFSSPHVVLAHDFYSPTVVCDPREFANADVIVLFDVVHSGNSLNALMSMCRGNTPRRVRGLALVDQSGGRSLCAEWYAVWNEERESRVPLDIFLHNASEQKRSELRRFEPNDECAIADHIGKSGSYRVNTATRSNVAIDVELVKHIHATGALKRDHMISQKRYPFAINVLDLLKKDAAARSFIIGRAVKELSGFSGDNVCLAYHVARSARAGEIAKLLGREMGWPTLAIGTRGQTFSLSDQQKTRLARYDTVVVVDAAIRTGDTISAIVRAVDDSWLRKHTKLVAFCILNALSHGSESQLASDLEIDIRTLFTLPLAPPTEEVRHWENVQKAAIQERIAKTGSFGNIQKVLGKYCFPPKYETRESIPSFSETKVLLEQAVYLGQSPENGVETIDKACRELQASLIRHLSVDEVVHDRKVQDLLVGIMYNSMTPSFKATAAFALAAANNYDWMNSDWLRCNQPFLASRTNAWKSVLVVECQMKMTNRDTELASFRADAIAFREELDLRHPTNHPAKQAQLSLPRSAEWTSLAGRRGKPDTREGDAKPRLIERLDAVIGAAS